MREFNSMGDFAVYFGGLVLKQAAADKAALTKAAELVERTAVRKIGHYQGSAGPFQAWPQLAAATQADRVRKGYTANDPLLRSGALFASISHEVGEVEAVVGSDDPVALWQEVGTTTNIPERSFLGGAAAEKADEVALLVGEGVVMSLLGGPTAIGLLDIGKLKD